MVEYGAVAVVVYLTLFTLTWAGFYAAIRFGWEPSSTAANVGIWTASYLATKVTQPLRIAATVISTPFIAKWYERAVAPLVGRRRPSRAGEEVPGDEQEI
jgi:hypothetical protein